MVRKLDSQSGNTGSTPVGTTRYFDRKVMKKAWEEKSKIKRMWFWFWWYVPGFNACKWPGGKCADCICPRRNDID